MTTIIPGVRQPLTKDIDDDTQTDLDKMLQILRAGIHRDFRGIWRIHVPFGGIVVSNRTSSAVLHHEVRCKVTSLDDLKVAVTGMLFTFEDTPFKFEISWAYSTTNGGATLGIKVSSSPAPA